jgi:dTDP-glucose 4,6-dehydratase
LDFAIHAGAKRFLITSSGGVYARTPTRQTHIPEHSLLAPNPLNTRSAYGEGKRVSELMGAIYQKKHGLQVLIARCFGFVGPYFPLDTSYAVGNFIQNVLKNEEIQIGGDGTPLRSFMYMADLVEWLLTILQRGEPLKPYHVGSEEGVSVAELANVITKVAGELNLPTKGIRIAKTPEPGRLPECYVPKTDLATELQLKCRHDLKESIRRTLLWNLSP